MAKNSYIIIRSNPTTSIKVPALPLVCSMSGASSQSHHDCTVDAVTTNNKAVALKKCARLNHRYPTYIYTVYKIYKIQKIEAITSAKTKVRV